MKRIFRPMTVRDYNGGRYFSVYFKVEDRGGRYMSFVGVVGPTLSGNAHGGCGQIDMNFDEYYSEGDRHYAKGWNRSKIDLLFALWERWHLKRPEEVPEYIMGLLDNEQVFPETDREPAWV